MVNDTKLNHVMYQKKQEETPVEKKPVKKAKKEPVKELDLDLNNDGKFDFQDASIAGKIQAKWKKLKGETNGKNKRKKPHRKNG